jgi:hypothetical protein
MWLMAGTAVVVPVLLHFRNDRRGKVVKVGSVAMLTGGSRRPAWSRRLTQWLLLLVRCLLLVALAVLMARPFFGAGPRIRGWVFCEGPVSAERDGAGSVVDSLIKAGWERHVLADTENYWRGFAEADREAPEGVPFFIRTPGLASRFAGGRPVTGREVRWEVDAPGDSVVSWIQAAWPAAGDSVMIVEGISRATGTDFRERSVDKTAVPDSVEIDTSVFRVVIYADADHRADKEYVKAAVKAVQQYTGRRMAVRERVEGGGDWLFWLSDRAPGDVRGFGRVFRYMDGRARMVRTSVNGIDWMKEIAGIANPGSAGGDTLERIWRDGYGRGVLVRGGNSYEFYSRLNPEWNGLVWSDVFPEWLERLFWDRGRVGSRDRRVVSRDRRVLDAGQIMPLKGAVSRKAVIGPPDSGRMDLPVWMIVVVLFILERLLAHGKTKN